MGKKGDIWQGKAANGAKLTIRRRSNKPVGKEKVEQLITLHRDKKQLTQLNVLWCDGEDKAIEVIKDMAMRYIQGKVDDEQVEAEKRVIRAKWMKEQRQLKKRPAATEVTGETKEGKEKAKVCLPETEPDRQNEKAQTKARRKSKEQSVNTPATSVSEPAPVSPPPSPPIWM